MAFFIQAIGWVGMSLIVLAYFLISNQYVGGNSAVYQFMNFFGALGVGVNVFYQKAWPALALQVVWALIAIVSLAAFV